MTVGMAPSQDTADLIQNLLDRVYKLEQRITSPAYTVPNGSSPTFTDITLGTYINGTSSGTAVVPASSSPTGLTTGTFANYEDVAITGTWSAPVDGSAVEYEFQLHLKDPLTSTYTLAHTARTTALTTTISGLIPGRTYGARVYGINRIGVVSAPFPVSGYVDQVATLDATLPSAPTGLAASPGATSITVRWNDNTEPDVGNGKGLYRIQRATDAGFTTDLETRITSATIVAFTDLVSGTPYYFRVKAIDSSGNESAYTSAVTATPGGYGSISDGVAPASSPAPIVNPLYQALEIRWSPIVNNDPVTYEVHVSASSGFTPNSGTKALEVSGTFAIVKSLPGSSTPLTYGTTYYVKLIAKDEDGSAAAGTQGSGVPSQVDNGDLAANSVHANQILAGAVNTEKLTVGSITDNALLNASFEEALSTDATMAAAWARGGWPGGYGNSNNVIRTNAEALSGTYSMALPVLDGTQFSSVSSSIAVPVAAGDKWHVRLNIKSNGAAPTGVYVRLIKQDGTELYSDANTLENQAFSTSWSTLQGSFTIPSSMVTAKVMVLMYGPSIGSGATLYVDSVEMRRVVSTTQIADGAIITSKIQTGQLNSDHIVTAGLDAAVIKFGTMSGDRITTNTLDAGAIKTSSISAATLTINSTGQIKIGSPGVAGQFGLLIDTNGIRLYSGTTPTVFLDATTGNGSFTGTINATGGSFSGSITASGTITGGTIQGANIYGSVFATSSNTSIDRLQADSAGVVVQREGTTNRFYNPNLIPARVATFWNNMVDTGWNYATDAADTTQQAQTGIESYLACYRAHFWKNAGVTTGGIGQIYQHFNAGGVVGASQTWTQSCWVYFAGTPSTNIVMQVDCYTSGGTFIQSFITNYTGTAGSWQRFKHTFTTPSNAAIFDFIYRVYGSGLSTAAYDVWFSQLQLEQKDHATFYADQFQPDCTATDATEAQTWLDSPATRITANVLQAKYDKPFGNTFRGKLVGLIETGYIGNTRMIVDQYGDVFFRAAEPFGVTTPPYADAGIGMTTTSSGSGASKRSVVSGMRIASGQIASNNTYSAHYIDDGGHSLYIYPSGGSANQGLLIGNGYTNFVGGRLRTDNYADGFTTLNQWERFRTSITKSSADNGQITKTYSGTFSIRPIVNGTSSRSDGSVNIDDAIIVYNSATTGCIIRTKHVAGTASSVTSEQDMWVMV